MMCKVKYLSILSAGQQISNTAQWETIPCCLFGTQETNEVNSIA